MFKSIKLNRLLIYALATIVLCPSLSYATTYDWNNTSGGLWSETANWSPAGPPGISDNADFDLDSSGYTVNLSGSNTISQLYVRSDILTLNISDILVVHNDDLWSVYVARSGDEGHLNITGGGTLASTKNLDISSNDPDSIGSITVSNATLRCDVQFTVGATGIGDLVIENNGKVETDRTIFGSYSKAVGTATVNGGSWNCSGYFVVGWDNIGNLYAGNGASIIQTGSANVYIGYKAGSTGNVSISGAGTIWDTGVSLRIGNGGKGSLSISDSAIVTSKVANIAINSGSYGDATIDSAQWVITDELRIGGGSSAGGDGIMTIKPNADVNVESAVIIWPQGILRLSGGTLTAESIDTTEGIFGWQSGELHITGTSGLLTGTAGDIKSIVLSASKTLRVDNNLTLASGGSINLEGGSVECNTLVMDNGTVAGSVIDLDDFNAVTGKGMLYGAISGTTGITVKATGVLTMGDPSLTTGYDMNGILVVDGNQVILLDSNRAKLGVLTTLSEGGSINGANGVRLDTGEILTATGNATIQGNLYNDGTVNGPTTAGTTLSLDDDVSGSGSFSGNMEFLQTYSPGSSPGIIDFNNGNIKFGTSAKLTMEINGSAASSFDQLINIGNMDFEGELEIVFAYTPLSGTEYQLFDYSTFSGSFSRLSVSGLDSSMVLDTSRLEAEGIIWALIPASPDFLGFKAGSGADPQVMFDGDYGLNYIIESNSNLLEQSGWQPVLWTNFPAQPFPWIHIPTDHSPTRFYRVRLLP